MQLQDYKSAAEIENLDQRMTDEVRFLISSDQFDIDVHTVPGGLCGWCDTDTEARAAAQEIADAIRAEVVVDAYLVWGHHGKGYLDCFTVKPTLQA